MRPKEVEEIAIKSVIYIIENWKQFSFIDNQRCAEIKLNKIPYLKNIQPLIMRSAIYDEIIQILKYLGFEIKEIRKKKIRCKCYKTIVICF